MKKQPSFYIVGGLIILGVIGVIGKLMTNPIQFLQGLLVTFIVIGIIYFLVRKFLLNKPGNKEQQAFIKAARRSKKRLSQKGIEVSPRKDNQQILRKRRSSNHLTVIEGNKGKKKRRAQM